MRYSYKVVYHMNGNCYHCETYIYSFLSFFVRTKEISIMGLNFQPPLLQSYHRVSKLFMNCQRQAQPLNIELQPDYCSCNIVMYIK